MFDPGMGRSPEEGNGNPLQHPCLGNPVVRGAWQATVHGITESDRIEHPHTNIFNIISQALRSATVLGSVAKSCSTLYDPRDRSSPGSSVHETSQQEYWSGLPFPSPGDLSDPGIKPRSPALQADASLTELQGKPLLAV